MPFGLKNAGATYHRAMNAIFHERLRKMVECYVDDITVKSRTKGDHIANLKAIFDIMRTHQLKMNPTKSFMGVASGNCGNFHRNLFGPGKGSYHSGDATSTESQRTQEIARTIGIHLKGHLKSLQKMPTLYQINEKGCLVHLGQYLPTNV